VNTAERVKPARTRTASLTFNLVALAVTLLVMVTSGREFLRVHARQLVVKGPGVTRVERLSSWFEGLRGSEGDTDVYVMEGAEPGGTMLVMGGVHANEPGGMMAAVLLVENVTVKSGRLFVIPQANASAATHVESSEGFPTKFSLTTAGGRVRSFRYGGRLTNPVHQWPDPEVYTHYPSGQLLSDVDVRNLDRAFPGRPDGCLTEQIAYGITELVRRERIGLTIDLHEARPMNPIVNCVIAHERAQEIAAIGLIEVEALGVRLRLEPSPTTLHGMSHRELGDHTNTLAMLLETSNPAMDRLRGLTNEDLVVTGRDDFFLKAARRGLLYAPYPEGGVPLEERVGRHMAAISVFATLFAELYPGEGVTLENIPEYKELKEKGVGMFLREPPG